MLWGSNTTLQFGAIGIRSPFASVRVLLSSNTLLRFSIQIASTGPSRTIHMCSPWNAWPNWMRLTSISRWTRTTCIAKPREARGRVARKMIGMGGRERNRVNCETWEVGFQILTLLRGFRDKIANFSRLHCLTIPRRDLSTKKIKPNIEKWPESHVRILIYLTFAIGSWDSFYISINKLKADIESV